MLLRDVSDLVVDRVQVGAVWWPQIRNGNKVRSLTFQQLNGFTGAVDRRVILLV